MQINTEADSSIAMETDESMLETNEPSNVIVIAPKPMGSDEEEVNDDRGEEDGLMEFNQLDLSYCSTRVCGKN